MLSYYDAIMQGITVGMCTLCSQAYGAGKHKLVGTYFMRALLIGLLTCFPLWSVWIGVTPMVYYITGDIELCRRSRSVHEDIVASDIQPTYTTN